MVAFILLNPSTADEQKDDPTIRRCIGYSKEWGFGGVIVGNAFALRSTDPKALYLAQDPIGPENDAHLRTIGEDAAMVVCGWGNHAALGNRSADVLRTLHDRRPHALSLTKNGMPGHPLYLRGGIRPFPIEVGPHGKARRVEGTAEKNNASR